MSVQPFINIKVLLSINTWTALMDMMFIHNSHSCEIRRSGSGVIFGDAMVTGECNKCQRIHNELHAPLPTRIWLQHLELSQQCC